MMMMTMMMIDDWMNFDNLLVHDRAGVINTVMYLFALATLFRCRKSTCTSR